MALTLKTVGLYSEPGYSDAPDQVGAVPANAIVSIISTTEDGEWYMVASGEEEGYLPATSVMVLNVPALAPKAVIASDSAGSSLFKKADLASEFIQGFTLGDMVTVLGVDGEWAYVMTKDGVMGWTIASSWVVVDSVQVAVIDLSTTDKTNVLEEPDGSSGVLTTLANGDVVYTSGDASEGYAQVLTMDGNLGWAVASGLMIYPTMYVDVATGGEAEAGLYAEADFAADVIGMAANGRTVSFISKVDDFWIEIVDPDYGKVYALADNFGGVYVPVKMPFGDAIVRSGPNDALYNSIAQLPPGQPVVVTGKNGNYYKVVVPLEEIDFAWYGVEGWMRSFLFLDSQNQPVFDASVLSEVE
ncbi:MAG: SH3 domain-containing protein [Anaerolineae bacterium]|nr:SH3 domain-containing protein [Anaerolineae bacterium]